ncbi:hypothetical protein SU69_08720 [Thermosipho melanesiensis]|uniref:Methyl-accepting chemotaxis sensory transducer n=1 Tax=Thermosipho melanesiensis TaxID=46541 RepID=A0ABM6GGK0_9BACT|nr:hypothetical protein [Thermosipho melanesiensis]APT74598.1 hypothetical protein BW47_09095 [Thermosipho melanesiensis]OOC35302.1 hypothetical protein SU69_08720 [Thermosipho melanesiensis]OOC35521.1 hypothetical protein SU70_08730 [Thermosipho melanesiensis]OOC36557.1 hypothetical protein SU68_08785 [Thermosipho melanesiensis]OOC40229.1 hypothetical protein SU71_08715 [Thermosipho melanesiensis]
MPVSVQAKRSITKTTKLTKFFKIVLLITIPVVLSILTVSLSVHYSRLSLEFQIQRDAFLNETNNLKTEISNLDKMIESLMIGSKTLK